MPGPPPASWLFGRAYRLLIQGVEFKSAPQAQGLRLAFETERDLTVRPNQGTVKLWNLSREQRESLASGRVKLELEAGYGERLGVVMTLDRVSVSHAHEGVDWVTTIEGGDGQAGLHTPLSLSFGEGATALDAIRKAAGASGLGIDALLRAAQEGDPKKAATAIKAILFGGGKTFSGTTAEAIEEIGRESGAKIHVQDGQLEALGPDETSPSPAVEVTPASGLIGTPQIFARPETPSVQLVRFQTALLPGLVPGRRIELDARAIAGQFRIEKARHEGDTHGGDGAWASTIEAKRIA